jgi:hypothetical protein
MKPGAGRRAGFYFTRHGRAFDPAIHLATCLFFGDVPNVGTAWMAGSNARP